MSSVAIVLVLFGGLCVGVRFAYVELQAARLRNSMEQVEKIQAAVDAPSIRAGLEFDVMRFTGMSKDDFYSSEERARYADQARESQAKLDALK